ncbi:MAG: chorismate lyase, partial [Gallionellales bacterium CG_4_9_14_0_8_um_filter_55_61]
MTFYRSDAFWRSSTQGSDLLLRPWLHDHGSLTGRIVARCEKFSVQPVKNGLARIAYDEAAVLG